MAVYQVQAPDGNIIKLEGPDGATPEEVMAQAQALYQPQEPPIGKQIADTVGSDLGVLGRGLAQGVVDTASTFANPLAYLMNKAFDASFPDQSQAFSEELNKLGVPVPHDAVQNAGYQIARGVGNFYGGMPLNNVGSGGTLIDRAAGIRANVPENFVTPRATQPASQLLEQSQIPLDKAQASGSTLLNRVRGATNDNPLTAGAAQKFNENQLGEFTRKILNFIGEDSSQATPEVMNSARQRIGAVFDKVGENGLKVDDQLTNDIAQILDEAQATVPADKLSPLIKNVQDLQKGTVDGVINGQMFTRIRSRLTKLSSNPDVGEEANNLQQALVGALGRTDPQAQPLLTEASNQWRSMRLIESAIGKSSDKYISPLALTNAMSTKAQRAATVYGLGGNQDMIALAQAARKVLPPGIAQSGTVPRGLMQAPARAIATGVPLWMAQRMLLAQPSAAPSVTPLLAAPLSGAVSGALQ